MLNLSDCAPQPSSKTPKLRLWHGTVVPPQWQLKHATWRRSKQWKKFDTFRVRDNVIPAINCPPRDRANRNRLAPGQASPLHTNPKRLAACLPDPTTDRQSSRAERKTSLSRSTPRCRQFLRDNRRAIAHHVYVAALHPELRFIRYIRPSFCSRSLRRDAGYIRYEH